MSMFAKYLNSTAMFSPPDDRSAAAAKERENITVETMKPEGNETDKDKESATEDKEKVDDDDKEVDEENEDDEDDDKEDDENKDVDKQETEEEKAARIAEAKLKRK